MLSDEWLRIAATRSMPAPPPRCAPTEPHAPGATRVTGNTRWAALLCRYSDDASTPEPLAYFTNLYTNTFPGLDPFWRADHYYSVEARFPVGYDSAHGYNPATMNQAAFSEVALFEALERQRVFNFDTFTHFKAVLKKPFWLDIPQRYMPYSDKLVRLLRRLI